MNWLHFLLWVAGIYALYYLAVILIDFAAGKRTPTTAATNELTFSESIKPTQLAPAPITEAISKAEPVKAQKTKYEPEVIGSGGVVIDNLFRLAKQEAIIYTRSVSF